MLTPRRRLLIAPNRTHSTNVSKLERAKSCVVVILREEKLQRRGHEVREARLQSLIVLVGEPAKAIQRYFGPLNMTDLPPIHCQGVGLCAGVFESRSVVCSSVV